MNSLGIIIVSVIVATFIGVVCMLFNNLDKMHEQRSIEREYCGKVIEKGYDAPSSGYKSHTDAQYWLVIMDEDVHQPVRVHVSAPCFYKLQKDDRACFTLSGYDMKYYGNTDFTHLK